MIPAALLREPATLICLELAGTGGLVRHVAGGGAADGEGVGRGAGGGVVAQAQAVVVLAASRVSPVGLAVLAPGHPVGGISSAAAAAGLAELPGEHNKDFMRLITYRTHYRTSLNLGKLEKKANDDKF